MSSLPPAAYSACRPAILALTPTRHVLAIAGVLLACAACDIDDRTFADSLLKSTSPRDAATDAGGTDAGEADSGAGAPNASRPPADDAPSEDDAPDAPRPILALGDAVTTGLLGGYTGKDERARCVEGVVIGFDYLFNDDSATSFPARFTFAKPVCAHPEVSDDTLVPGWSAEVAWSTVGGDTTPVTRPVPTHRLLCPDGYVVVGLHGSMDEVQADPQTFAVRELELDCAPLHVNSNRSDVVRGPVASVTTERVSAARGAIDVQITCEEGTTAATGASVRWGSWLDGVGLQCSRLTWPFPSGHGCALDEDCQSGVCESWATCGE